MNSNWNVEDSEQLWDNFLQRWPMEALPSIHLENYARAGDADCFVNWLESKTERLGSIWGGAAFKFGIYHRDDKQPKESGRGRVFGTEYAWYEKYGHTPEEAFANVLAQVVKVAQAARSGDFAAVEEADLGAAVKWKIAFLYQDRAQPRILPIYNLESLRAAAGKEDSHETFYELNQEFMQQRGDAPLFQYAKDLWTKGKEVLSRILSQDDALAFLQNRFSPLKEHVQYIAGFATNSGRQLALVRRGKEVTVFVETGDWPKLVPGLTLRKAYAENEPRVSGLDANAPQLAVGHPADYLVVPTMAALVALCDAYDDDGAETDVSKAHAESSQSVPNPNLDLSNMSKNRILYGPPGTGKTYRTAQIAVEICDGHADPSRTELMARYEELRTDGRIYFVTFHQSYGYEDFIEGLRPELENGQIHYRVRPGVFRNVCDAARRSTLVKPGLTGKALKDRTIYKMSLGVAGTSAGNLAFDECVKNGYVLLGYGDDVDFTECKTGEEVQKAVKDAPILDKPESHARYVSIFKLEVQVGDIVVVSQGNGAFRAIGEITGEYEFLEAPAADTFHQMRRVRWLRVFENNRLVEEIYDRKFSQSTLYKLDSAGLKFNVIQELIKKPTDPHDRAFVLIIDEINRANISKVFGELISLLEPDKREGAENALTAKLPYSGEDFTVPSNLYVVGTMNTADRSIAVMDTALRRRFEFEELQADYDALPEQSIAGVDVRATLRALNDRIEYLSDRDHTIGHAYFISVKTLSDLDAAFRRKVIPLLQEYFYEDFSKVVLALNDKSGHFIESTEETPFGLETPTDGFDAKIRYRVRGTPFPLEGYQSIYS